MTSQLKQSFQDVIPTFQGQIPSEVLSCGDTLYQLSLQKQPVLPKRSEIARYHICAFLAAEKYQQQLQLPEPETNRIPLQPKLIFKLLDDFRENLLYQIRSTSSTPKSSPRKNQHNASNTPFSTPTRVPNLSPLKNTPKVSSPLKRLHQLRDEDETSTAEKNSDFWDVESPFNPKKTKAVPDREGEGSPLKKKKGSPSKSPAKTLYKYDRKHVTIEDFISFANNFFIPATITPKIIETFLVHKHKFTKKSEWLLACGLIHSAYTRINHQLITAKMGAKSQLTNQLFQYQKGGLMKWSMLEWCVIVDDWIKDEPWIHAIEKQYMYESQTQEQLRTALEITARNGEGWELQEKLGSMLHGDVLYESESQNQYYETWTNNVLTLLGED